MAAQAMLTELAIRDIVLIEALDLAFGGALTVLTGETGAGKSILLDALGLAIGVRAEPALVRAGSAQASVTARFALGPNHPALALLAANDLAAPADDDMIIRRVLTAEGRSRASVNDQPISVGLLRQVGQRLVEIHGQFGEQGLLNPASHRALLDQFAQLTGLGQTVAAAWRLWREATSRLGEARADIDAARREQDFLTHAVTELTALDPQPGEEEALAQRRTLLQQRDRLIAALHSALTALTGEHGAARGIATATRQLIRLGSGVGPTIDPVVAMLDRASGDIAEAEAALEALSRSDDFAADQLDAVEQRLFALRAAARKHQVGVGELPLLTEQLRAALAAIDDASARLARLAAQETAARTNFEAAAARLSAHRLSAAEQLDQAVMAELPPLKLDKAVFRTVVEPLDPNQWGEHGCDRVAFQIATSPGAPPGPLAKIASGGELSRFMLALRLVLAGSGGATTLVFDEVDSGIGGATAAAVGERLARLGRVMQVLVVTHSPQVAVLGTNHLEVRKAARADGVRTLVSNLDPAARQEEIARMLSGQNITDEARAAAGRLMAGSS